MNILYAQNPLFSKIILTEQEQEILKLKIKISELEEAVGMSELYLQKGETAEAIRYLNGEYIFDGGLDKRVDVLFQHYMGDAEWKHEGDCTSVACSCSKCHLETFLGIDTIPNMSKYVGHVISGAFEKDTTCIEAINKLKARQSDYAHVKYAIEWLENYITNIGE